MHFVVLPALTRPSVRGAGIAVLVRDNWDDHRFRTTSVLHYSDGETVHTVGQVKIGQFGMRAPASLGLPDRFDALDDTYFSLGQDDRYYERLRELGDDVRLGVLRALHDVAFDQVLFERALGEEVTRTSLLRSVTKETVVRQFRRIARGGVRLRPFRFAYTAPPPAGGQEPLTLDFAVDPESSPPTNVHAVIGSNGVGKTRLLGRLAWAVADGAATVQEAGEVTDLSGGGERPFANMVSVASSAFDTVTPVRQANGTQHAHVTLAQNLHGDAPDPAGRFKKLVNGLTGARLERWLNALATLTEADPLLRDAQVPAVVSLTTARPETDPVELFEGLSSGHKIVLLAVTSLVELVTERTLVLIDEPETHLHPPLLAAFMRAVSDLLVDRNGVAIIATHSPVVLQETPRTCVWMLRRSGDVVRAKRPDVETFGENVGVLTHEAFGLEVTRSGFHRDLQQAVADGLSYHGVLDRFGGQLGGEARSLARALIAVRDHREDLL